MGRSQTRRLGKVKVRKKIRLMAAAQPANVNFWHGCVEYNGHVTENAACCRTVTVGIVMVITEIVAPQSAQQVCNRLPQTPPAPPLDSTDQRILKTVRGHGPIKLWSLLNWLTQDEDAGNRAAGRSARLDLWHHRVKRLKRLKLVHGSGRNELVALNPDRQATRPRPLPRRRTRTVTESLGLSAVSAGTTSRQQEEGHPAHPVHFQMDNASLVPSPATVDAGQTKRVPAPELISAAARQLASLPRRGARRWSGWLANDVRSYRNMRIQIPGGDQVFVFGVLRGRLVYTREENGPVGNTGDVGTSWGVTPAKNVEVVRNQHAVLLGRLKAGTVERRSALKIATARANGQMPARRGRRGRPIRTPRQTKSAH